MESVVEKIVGEIEKFCWSIFGCPAQKMEYLIGLDLDSALKECKIEIELPEMSYEQKKELKKEIDGLLQESIEKICKNCNTGCADCPTEYE